MWIQIDPEQFEKRGADYIRERLAHYKANESEDDGKYFAAAKEMQIDGDLEFDDDAVISVSEDDGAYVMGWKWINDLEAEVTRDCDEDEDELSLAEIEESIKAQPKEER